MSLTNRGKIRIWEIVFRGQYNGGALPTNLYIRLVTSATAPTVDTNLVSELTEIASGNGYTAGGFSLSKNSTDFDTLTEDDTNNRGDILIKDVAWTASGGPLPASGNGARYAVLTDDNATDANREVLAFWDLTTDRSVSDTQDLTLQDLGLRLNEAA